MLKNLSIFNFKKPSKIPLAFGICLVLIFMTEIVARSYAPRIRSFSDIMILHKKALLEGKERLHFDGIFMGDSRILGLDASVISKQVTASMGRKVEYFNFSLPDHGVRGYYLFLKKYLKRHQRPETIFFSVAPQTLSGEWNIVKNNKAMSTRLHRFCLLFSLTDYAEVFPPKFWWYAFIAKVERESFLISYRRMIRSFLESFKGEDRKTPDLQALTSGRNGGVRFGQGTAPDDVQIQRLIDNQKKFSYDEDSLFWYKKFLALARDHDIKVVIFNAPIIEALDQHRQKDRTHLQYQKLMKELKKEFHNVTLLMPLFMGYESRYFRDMQHLNGEGFRRFSRELGVALK